MNIIVLGICAPLFCLKTISFDQEAQIFLCAYIINNYFKQNMLPNFYGFNSNFYDPYYQNFMLQSNDISNSAVYHSYFNPSNFNEQKLEQQRLYDLGECNNNFLVSEPKPTQNRGEVHQVEFKQKKRRGIDKFKQMQSAKKNSQSNITNQYFSFYSNRLLSYQNLLNCVRKLRKKPQQEQKIVSIFYNIMQCISSQRGKKYVNRKTMTNFFFADTILEQIPKLDEQINKLGFITLEEICKLIRQCCYNYLRFDCNLNVISSKRISQASKGEHLKRRRIILKNMMDLMLQANCDIKQ